jgi:hypothetical protein
VGEWAADGPQCLGFWGCYVLEKAILRDDHCTLCALNMLAVS